MVSILEQSEKRPAHRHKLYVTGRPDLQVPAELTYRLHPTERAPERDLLRITQQGAFRLFPGLQTTEGYRRFLERVPPGDLGALRRAKALAVDLGRRQDPELAIAVHQFGPVPVFLLPERITVSQRNKPVQCDIAVYPDLNGYSGDRSIPSNQRSGPLSVYLQAYGIDLATTLLKYQEDVGEFFHDMRFYLSRTEVAEACRMARDTLSGSLRRKLSDIDRGLQSSVDEERELACALVDRYGHEIRVAELACELGTGLVNEMLVHCGVGSHRWDRQSWSEAITSLACEPGPDGDADGIVDLLMDCATVMGGDHAPEPEQWQALSGRGDRSGVPWLGAFVDMTGHILRLRRHEAEAQRARVFVSHRHDDSVAGSFFDDLEERINSEFALRCDLERGTSGGPKKEICESARIGVWRSDVLLCAIPPRSGAGADKPDDMALAWVLSELDHGCLTMRQCIPYVAAEWRAHRSRAADGLRAVIDGFRSLLAPSQDRVRSGGRQANLRRVLVDEVTRELSVGHRNDPATNPQELARDVVERALYVRAMEALVSLMLQIPQQSRSAVAHLLQMLEEGTDRSVSRRTFENRLSVKVGPEAAVGFGEALDRAYQALTTKKIAAAVGGERVNLIDIARRKRRSGPREYRSNARRIVELLHATPSDVGGRNVVLEAARLAQQRVVSPVRWRDRGQALSDAVKPSDAKPPRGGGPAPRTRTRRLDA